MTRIYPLYGAAIAVAVLAGTAPVLPFVTARAPATVLGLPFPMVWTIGDIVWIFAATLALQIATGGRR